ncbi:MAG TPA: hypothetical protein VLI05_01705 [Candidatus Saccharimonadia bacterium]|nr:hypothetical protein [Candidatus Saccharimonadia bacterium]
MQQRLANFSVETDELVLLEFSDGQERRVRVRHLGQVLASADLKRVNAALKLRHDFLKTHLPKASLAVVLVGGLLALLLTNQRAVARLMSPDGLPGATVSHDEIAGAVAPRVLPESPAPSVAMPARLRLGSASHLVVLAAAAQAPTPAATEQVAPLLDAVTVTALAPADQDTQPVKPAAGATLTSLPQPTPAPSPKPVPAPTATPAPGPSTRSEPPTIP